MKTIGPGVKEEADDAIIVALLKSEGLWQSWESIHIRDHTRVFLYPPKDRPEIWIFQEFKGVPGDEGLLLHVIDIRHIFDDHVIKMLMGFIANGWDLSTLGVRENPGFSPRNN